VFFSADDGQTGRELWKSDGTEAGTVLVKDIFPGADYYGVHSSNPGNLTNANGILFFAADDGETDRELWKSNGNQGGTISVADILPGSHSDGSSPLSSSPGSITALGNSVLFNARVAGAEESWVSDGTKQGTIPLADDRANNLTKSGNELFFVLETLPQSQLWKSDGTQAGRVRQGRKPPR
jgi:large repetitive protein